MFLIWIDILGFDKLASEVSKSARIEEREVRKNFISTINNEVTKLQEMGHICGVKYGQSDDWLLVAESLDNIYHILDTILSHNTGYKDYSKIPLEVGIEYSQFDQYADLEGVGLSVENNTIAFLKSHIINEFRNWYKEKNNTSIKESFIVLTEKCYSNLGIFDREHCIKIEHNAKIFYKLDINYVRNKAKFMKFLKIINIEKESLYGSLNDVFVEPNEFDSAIQLLEKNNIVFIVGDPEIGKTFTAIKLLWMYYLKGYKPKWIRGYEFSDRKEIRKIMVEGSELKPKVVIYLEDPFGKTKYEDADTIRREIGAYINRIKNMDVKVIFTSRLNIFNQFLKAKISVEEIENISIDMLLMKPSYGMDKMEKILINWSKYFNAKWLQKKEIKDAVIKNALRTLKTPLSIRDFAIEALNIEDLNVIKSIINKKSKETKKSFAEEVKNMNYERILFLSLNYILFSIEQNEIKTIYNEICLKNNLNAIKNNYEDLLQEFKYKIRISERNEFAHPSYEEGLVESWNYSEVFNFIIQVMNSLIKNKDPIVRGLVGFTLTENYGLIDKKEAIEPIILSVLKDKKADARLGVAMAASFYPKEIPLQFKIDLINRFIKDRHREIRACALNMISNDFELIPCDLRLNIIRQGLNDRAAFVRLEAVITVRSHLKSLPKEMVLNALECNKALLDYSGWFIRFIASIYYPIFKKEVEEYLTA